MKRQLLTLLLLVAAVNVHGQGQDFPKEINLVFDYLLKKDFPELFNDKPYQFRPVDWQIIDIDGDGTTEVFLQTFPHYVQSPTITIFHIDKNDTVSRVIEGFAPGHLIPPSAEDDYLTPHATGTGIDLQVGSNDPEKMLKFSMASIRRGMSAVLYKNFIHADQRKGPVFVDLSYLNDYSSEGTCEKFQFSRPEKIVAGKINGASSKFFISKTGNELFCYEIKGFKTDGTIDKTVSIIKAPKRFTEFVVEEGVVKYKTKKGKIVELKV